MAGLTDLMENTWLDFLFRGQALPVGGSTATWDAPPSIYVGLLTSAPTDSAPGNEVASGSYARVEVPCSLANWAGTQGAGTTTVSTGTSGTTSNNAAVTFPAPTSNWGTVTCAGLYDSVGDLLAYCTLTAPLVVFNGDPAPSFPAGSLIFTVD